MENRNSEKREFLWNVYTAISDLIKFSDTKAGAVIASNGLIIGIIFSNIIVVNALLVKSMIFPALVTVGGIALFFSTFFSLLSLIPNLSVGEPSSIIFFAHIAKRTGKSSGYKTAFNKVFTDGEELNQIADQIWAISMVAKRKYLFVGISIWLFAGVVIITLLFILFGIAAT